MTSQIFTFGFNHKYPNGYVKVYGKDKSECRDKMFEKYGSKWAFQYDNEEKAGVKEFNLFKVED